MDRRDVPVRPHFGAATAVVFALVAALSICSAAAAPVTVGGPFALTASDGTTVTEQTYRGRWLLVVFGYTSCPEVCPTTLSEIAAALELLGRDATQLQPIFITVDPERDTRDVLAQYTAAIDRRIVGLTGSPQQVADAAAQYGAYSERHSTGTDVGDYVVDHSTYIYIMDPEGRFVRGLDFGVSAATIADTVRKIMARYGG
jgi:protein SCO1/2